jgi:colicin import membrane protein
MSEPSSDRWLPRVLSLLVHGLIVVLFLYGWWHFQRSAAPPRRLSIEGTIVDPKALDPVSTQRPPALPPTPAPPPPPATPAPEDAQQKQREADALAAQQRAAAQAAADKAATQRAAEEKAVAAQAAAQKAAAEKAVQEKAAAEAAAKAAAEKAREDAAKAKQERERAASEGDLRRRLAAEERLAAAQSSGLQDQWVAQIQARIQRAWIRPPSAKPGIDCTVEVVQVPGGEVVSAHVAGCNGDAAVQQSIEAAVFRASPLPAPPDPSLFVRNLEVRFKPND